MKRAEARWRAFASRLAGGRADGRRGFAWCYWGGGWVNLGGLGEGDGGAAGEGRFLGGGMRGGEVLVGVRG